MESVVTREQKKRSEWKPTRRTFCKTRTTPYKLWSETVLPTPAKHRTASPWRDIDQQLKLTMTHYALKDGGPVHSFTLNLGFDVEGKALAQGLGAKDWLADRMSYHLKAALGRKPRYWFVMERAEGVHPYLHLHGEIGCSNMEAKAVREALRKVGGKWAGVKQTQIEMKENPDIGWISYVTKPDLAYLGPIACHLAGGAPPKPSWRNHRVFIEQGASRLARRLYDAVRDHLTVETEAIRDLMGPRSPPSGSGATAPVMPLISH